ncbi:MAG: helix-turn-helix domain-containing protein [Planctomycetes bacterium]|nr:helix-turn-helix domain-containing protein [Planctomycetota bacterium]
MSNQLKMAQIHTIEQLLRHGWSHRRIARELDIHRDTVARVMREVGRLTGVQNRPFRPPARGSRSSRRRIQNRPFRPPARPS